MSDSMDEPTDEEIEATNSPTAKLIAELERENAKLREENIDLKRRLAETPCD